MAELLFALEAAQENTDTAMILGEAQFALDLIHRHQRHHRHPLETSGGCLPDIGEPAVVGLADRVLANRIERPGTQEHGRVEHLNVDLKLVHVLEPRGDVAHLARFLRGVGADVAFHRLHPAVDDPEFLLLAAMIVGNDDVVGFLGADPRLETAEFRVEILERGLAFDHMGIGVYGSHGGLPSLFLLC